MNDENQCAASENLEAHDLCGYVLTDGLLHTLKAYIPFIIESFGLWPNSLKLIENGCSDGTLIGNLFIDALPTSRSLVRLDALLRAVRAELREDPDLDEIENFMSVGIFNADLNCEGQVQAFSVVVATPCFDEGYKEASAKEIYPDETHLSLIFTEQGLVLRIGSGGALVSPDMEVFNHYGDPNFDYDSSLPVVPSLRLFERELSALKYSLIKGCSLDDCLPQSTIQNEILNDLQRVGTYPLFPDVGFEPVVQFSRLLDIAFVAAPPTLFHQRVCLFLQEYAEENGGFVFAEDVFRFFKREFAFFQQEMSFDLWFSEDDKQVDQDGFFLGFIMKFRLFDSFELSFSLVIGTGAVKVDLRDNGAEIFTFVAGGGDLDPQTSSFQQASPDLKRFTSRTGEAVDEKVQALLDAFMPLLPQETEALEKYDFFSRYLHKRNHLKVVV